MTKSAGNCGFGHIYWKILNRKLHFLYSEPQALTSNLTSSTCIKCFVESNRWTNLRFLDEHKVLYKFQTGFRKNHSTDIYLSYLTNKISNGFDSALPTGMVSIELQKTFDTKDHNVLM